MSIVEFQLRLANDNANKNTLFFALEQVRRLEERLDSAAQDSCSSYFVGFIPWPAD